MEISEARVDIAVTRFFSTPIARGRSYSKSNPILQRIGMPWIVMGSSVDSTALLTCSVQLLGPNCCSCP